MKPLSLDAPLNVVVARLAAPDRVIREKTLRFLQSWMQRRKNELTFTDYLQIWKGLSFTVWLADRLPVIREASVSVAKLTSPAVSVVPEWRHAEFLAAFLLTLQNDWDGLDKWRIEKYQTLVRILTAELIDQMRRCEWKFGLVRSVFSAFTATSPCLVNKALPEGSPRWYEECKPMHRTVGSRGLTLQFIESFVEEWRKQLNEAPTRLGNDSGELSQEAFCLILSFFGKLLASSHSDLTTIKVIFEKFITPIVADGFFHSDSRPTVMRLVATLLFRVAAMRKLAQFTREHAMELIQRIDEELESLGETLIDYSNLSELEEMFSSDFSVLSSDLRSFIPYTETPICNQKEASTSDETAPTSIVGEEASSESVGSSEGATEESSEEEIRPVDERSPKRKIGPVTEDSPSKKRKRDSDAPLMEQAQPSVSSPAKGTRRMVKKRSKSARFLSEGPNEVICVPSFFPISTISGLPPPSLTMEPSRSAIKPKSEMIV